MKFKEMNWDRPLVFLNNFLDRRFPALNKRAAYITLSIISVTVLAASIVPDSAVGNSLASGAALLIAFVAYPWQKNLDREIKIAEERRALLLGGVTDVQSLYATLAADIVSVDAASPGALKAADGSIIEKCAKLTAVFLVVSRDELGRQSARDLHSCVTTFLMLRKEKIDSEVSRLEGLGIRNIEGASLLNVVSKANDEAFYSVKEKLLESMGGILSSAQNELGNKTVGFSLTPPSTDKKSSEEEESLPETDPADISENFK